MSPGGILPGRSIVRLAITYGGGGRRHCSRPDQASTQVPSAGLEKTQPSGQLILLTGEQPPPQIPDGVMHASSMKSDLDAQGGVRPSCN